MRSPFEGLYNPRFVPEEHNLNDFVQEIERRVETRQTVKKKLESTDTPFPLTREEVDEIGRIAAGQLKRIGELRERINTLRSRVDQAVINSYGKEPSFTLDISKKPTLKRAIQRVFGISTNVITYSMYKQAIELKSQLERNETQEYLKNGGVS